MSGVVTGLRFQKHTAERVNVDLDGQFAFGLPAVEAARLRVGQRLSDADIERLTATDAEQRAYDLAVHFLGFRPRSQAEVRRHLVEAGVAEPVVDVVIGRLGERGYLDDAEFARFWVESREQFRPRSPQALRQELRLKGVTGDAIVEALAAVDAAESAYRAAQPRASVSRPWPRRTRQLFSGGSAISWHGAVSITRSSAKWCRSAIVRSCHSAIVRSRDCTKLPNHALTSGLSHSITINHHHLVQY